MTCAAMAVFGAQNYGPLTVDCRCSDLNDKYSVAALRKKLKSVVADRHDDVMARMGNTD